MKVVFTGGGTAGHVFPAINVAHYLKEHAGAEIHYIGNQHFIEASIAMQHHIPFYSIPSRGLEGKNAFDKYTGFAIHNTRGVFKALRLLKEIQPDFVFATGGFVCAPVLAACQLLKIPYSIHEQNSVLGKVNRLFKEKAEHVFYSFPTLETENVKYSGNPVRFKEKLEQNGEKVVFIGGSGGSAQLNETAIGFAQKHPEIPCVLLTGKPLFAVCNESIIEKEITNLEAIAYTDDMQEIYKSAKIIICRSGSGTIFEIANLSIPSIFVPLPTSADDHQKKNALYFEQQKACLLIEQGNGFEKALEESILELWKDDEKRTILKENMDQLAVRESEKVIAQGLLGTSFQPPLHTV